MVCLIKLKTNKKAQFYLFTAIVLIGISFTLIPSAAKIEEPKKSFSQLYKNFIKESPYVINSAVKTHSNLTYNYTLFVNNFLAFARTRDPQFGLLYALAYGDDLRIGNRLPFDITINTSSTSFGVNKSASTTINRTAWLKVNFTGNSYILNITSSERYLSKAIFRTEREDEIRIYVED